MYFKPSIVALGSLAGTALAHGTVSGFITDGTFNQGFLLNYYYQKANGGSLPDIAGWYAEDLDNGFISPDAYSTSDINCHKNSEPGAITATVAAGGTVEFQWTTWPHGIGPVMTYVAACDGDCSAADKTTLKWVKIDEAGYDTTTKTWAAQKMIDNNSTWTTTVPASLKAGNYVFRHETIALHGASSTNGAQNYPQCMNIAVTGSGTELPEGTLGTALYTASDPGILFNPYVTITSYTIPGPAVMAGASSGSGSSSGGSASTTSAASGTTAAASATAPATSASNAATTSAAATPTTTSTTGEDDDGCPADETDAASTAVPTTLVTATRATTASATQTSGASNAVGAALYAQCGGTGFTGSTTCAEGTCVKQNDYYSQCLNS